MWEIQVEVINNFTDKHKSFELLNKLGVKIPITKYFDNLINLDDMIFPCIIKPSKESGGSVFVFLAENKQEAKTYCNFLIKNGLEVIVQEYLNHTGGEFTIGLISSPKREIIGSIVLKRLFNSKISLVLKGKIGIISGPHS